MFSLCCGTAESRLDTHDSGGTSDGIDGTQDGTDGVDGTLGSVDATDSADGTNGTDGTDGTSDTTDGAVNGTDGQTGWPAFQIGLNETGETAPSFFEAVEAGGEVPIELGPQGAWMLVAAVRTNAFPSKPKKAKVKASLITEGGTIFGKATFKKKAMFVGSNGYSYMMNIWLVVSSKKDSVSQKLVWEDQEAVLSVSIESAEGEFEEDSFTVTMYKENVTEQNPAN